MQQVRVDGVPAERSDEDLHVRTTEREECHNLSWGLMMDSYSGCARSYAVTYCGGPAASKLRLRGEVTGAKGD